MWPAPSVLLFLLFTTVYRGIVQVACFSSPSPQNSKREPWDVLRFIQQSSKFISPPKNPFSQSQRKKITPGETLWQAEDGGNENKTFQWSPLDDVVMGGVSSSTFDNATGMWRGVVSDSNSGGFVGIRTRAIDRGSALDMESCNGVEFRLRGGDARRFKAVVRDSADFNGVCWSTSFDIPNRTSSNTGFWGGMPMKDQKDMNAGDGRVSAIRIPFDKQTPTIFAKKVADQTFDAGNVVGLQLTYSKFEYDGELNKNFSLGDFSLQLVEVKAF